MRLEMAGKCLKRFSSNISDLRYFLWDGHLFQPNLIASHSWDTYFDRFQRFLDNLGLFQG